MTVLFGTLGFTPTKLLPSVTSHGDVRRLVFYHDRHDLSRQAAERVRAFCHERSLEVEGREIDAFDIIECATRMRRDVRRFPREEVVFNVTGGTPVLSSAATLTCILEGLRCVTIDERSGREVPLPLLSVRYDDVLNPEQRRILAFVASSGAAGCTQADVMRGLGLSRGTISHHVRNLKRKQLLRTEPDAQDARKERLGVLSSAALLLMDEAVEEER